MSRPPLQPGPYLVVGLRRSGQAAARALSDHGEVIGLDSGDLDTGGLGFEAHTGTDGVELLDRVATVVKSPGVPWTAPVIEAAVARGTEVTGELEVAWRLIPDAPFVGVTGTNGKTTTVELLGAIWRAAGEPAEVVGNVGRPVSDLVAVSPSTRSAGMPISSGATVICECSSFQLEDASAFAPEAGLLLNVEEDHLDRHGSMAAYRDAKLSLFARQGPDAVAVAHAGFGVPGRGRRITFGAAESDPLRRAGDTLLWEGEPLIDVGELSLRGEHNVENAMGAAAVALARGLDREAVAHGLREFGGVPHRLEDVGSVAGVLYVNDSKATNPASAIRGIEAFDGGVHVILGGSLKGGGFTALREAVAARCVAAYLIGDAEPRLHQDLDGAVELMACGTLERAVEMASDAALPGQVVLLSPACASFDAFDSYEQRGAVFGELVGRRG